MKTRQQKARENAHFKEVRKAEFWYSQQLRKIARHVGEIIKAYPIGNPQIVPEIISVLTRYADVIQPWAKATAARMIAEVSRRDAKAWFKASEALGRNLRQEINATDIGQEIREILATQVGLITSIPTDAAQRVQQLTADYIAGGKRYEELVPMILDSGNVTISRANLIARTEVAKASSALTQARAKFIGAEAYIWHTVRDNAVREAHKKLEGTIHKWDNPPIAELNGTRHHPGEFPNCRCWAEPLIPDVLT